MADGLKAELLVDCRNTLGEGIQWNPHDKRLYWTDIQERQIWSADERGEAVDTWTLPERVGAFAFDRGGDLLLALESGLHAYEIASENLRRLTEFEMEMPTTRMNDGRCDRDGRFIVGGMDEASLGPLSSVVCFAPDGSQKLLIAGVGCTNSICFSPDGTAMYFADTRAKDILRYPYDRTNGSVGSPELFLVLDEDEGWPDGSCVDAEGCIWNAQWGGAGVQCFTPAGERSVWVDVPVSNVTCCCFGGPDLDRLFITTARDGLHPDELEAEARAGGVFVCDVGRAGLPEDRFAAALGTPA